VNDERASVAIQAGGGKTPYQTADGTFKTSPAGHASCFENCHWDKDDPKKDNCAGCHFTPAAIAKKERNLLPPNAGEWFTGWPREWPKRLSIKFSHESKNHGEVEIRSLYVRVVTSVSSSRRCLMFQTCQLLLALNPDATSVLQVAPASAKRCSQKTMISPKEETMIPRQKQANTLAPVVTRM